MNDENKFSVDEILEAERKAKANGAPEEPEKTTPGVTEEPDAVTEPETEQPVEEASAEVAQPAPEAEPQPVEVQEDSPWDTYEEEEEPGKKKKSKKEKKEKKGFWARRREKKQKEVFNEAEDMYYGIQLKPIDEYTRGFDATGEILWSWHIWMTDTPKVFNYKNRSDKNPDLGYYAMDRNNNYDRTEKAYSALVYGEGDMFSDAEEAVKTSYQNGVTDEFIKPCVITENGEPVAKINANDSIIFFNFRPDRARQLTRCFIDRDFPQFERRRGYFPVKFVCMSQYSAEFNGRVSLIVPPEQLSNTMGEYLSSLGKTQLRIAETEKYAHVTFFFNGGIERVFDGEDRILVPSPNVATYDLKPEMSAYEVTRRACECIDSGKYDFMVLNFANTDMVGHTGVFEAAVKAVETVDVCVGTLVDHIIKNGGACLITADHGNCEQMLDEKGEPFTPHTTNPVPLIWVSDDAKGKKLRDGGRLCDLAPTLLDIMHLPVPKEMTGHSLIER